MKQFVPLALILLAACASGTATIDPAFEPAFNVRVVAVPGALPATANPFATVVEVDIINRSPAPLVLRRIDVASFGQGRYTVIPVSQTFGGKIGAGERDSFPVRVQVIVEPTLSREEEPILIRVLLYFESSEGAFRRSFLQRVNPSTLQ